MREYTCHTQSAGKISLPELSTPGTEAAVVPVSAVADTYNHFCDTPPSWQNSTQSILAAGAGIVRFAATIAGDTVGYIAGDPALGDIMAFAVRPDMRGKGIGTALLKTFLSANQADIVKILNVDTVATPYTPTSPAATSPSTSANTKCTNPSVNPTITSTVAPRQSRGS